MIADEPPQTIGVLVATYHRPSELIRCLQGLKRQTRLPDDVIVVAREDDGETREALRDFDPEMLPLRLILVDKPGVVHARNAGCDACRTAVLCMIDDDAVPRPEWVERVLAHFVEDARLGGVGGRDHCFDGTAFDEGRAEPVGKLQWFGRRIGNHHLGFGAPRFVDILKGANMSFRAEAFKELRFDGRLRGAGAQPNEDLTFSLGVKRAGWKLLYDPAVLVDHYVGAREEVRHYGGVMPLTDVRGFRDFAYNECIALWDYLPPWRRVLFVLWSVLFGTRVSPGLAQAIRFTPQLGIDSWRRFIVEQHGKFSALRDLVTR